MGRQRTLSGAGRGIRIARAVPWSVLRPLSRAGMLLPNRRGWAAPKWSDLNVASPLRWLLLGKTREARSCCSAADPHTRSLARVDDVVGENDGRLGTRKGLICALVSPSLAIQTRSFRTAWERDDDHSLTLVPHRDSLRHRKLSLLFDTSVSERLQFAGDSSENDW